MLYTLRRFSAFALIVTLFTFGFGQVAVAASYGEGNYAACNYQQDCPDNTTDSTTAPNTGLRHMSPLWPTVIGIVGLSMISFVVIRYLNRAKSSD